MTIQTQNKDIDLLNEIAKIADDYGVKSCDIYPSSQLAEIVYKEIGHGTALSNIIEDMLGELAPEKDHSIKMIPSDKKLIVKLL